MLNSADPDGHTFAKTYGTPANPRYVATGPDYIQNMTLMSNTTDGNGAVTAIAYNGDGFLQSKQDTIGTLTISAWDTFGLPLHLAGPRAGYTQDIVYDDAGRVSTLTENSPVAASTTSTFTTDPLGQVKKIVLPDGRTMRYHHDMQGNLIATEGPLATDADKAAGLTDGGATGQYYDAEGSMLAAYDENGNSISRTVNTLGALLTSTDTAGAVTTYQDFDALLDPATTMLPPVNDGGVNKIVTHEYDLIGRTTKTVLPQATVQGNGDLGAGGPLTYTCGYNDGAKTVTCTDPKNLSTVKTKLPSGRLALVTGQLGDTLTLAYDGNGRTNKRTPSGSAAQETTWNQYGQVTQSDIQGTSLITTYVRDAAGAVVTKTLPGGIVYSTPTDALGRVPDISIGGTAVQHLDFNTPTRPFVPTAITDVEANRLTSVDANDVYNRMTQWHSTIANNGNFGSVSAGGLDVPQDATMNVANAATYRNTGETLTDVDGNSKTSTSFFDGAGRHIADLDQNNLGRRVAYTQTGRVKTVTDDRGKVTTYIYDPQTAFLNAVQYADGKGVVYKYDALGNKRFTTYATTVDGTGNADGNTLTYESVYDSDNRRTQQIDPAGNVTNYTYYNNGKLESVTDSDNRYMLYFYDQAGRTIKTIANPGGLVTDTTYDNNGQIKRVDNPDGTYVSYRYDVRGRKIEMDATGESNNGVVSTFYHYNANGDMDTMTDPNLVVTTYYYDNAHRLVREDIPGDTPDTPRITRHIYDKAGFKIGDIDPKGQWFSFDNFEDGRRRGIYQVTGPNQQLPLGTFTWDGSTPTSDGVAQWSLDPVGRVTNVSGGGVNVAYQYNHPQGKMTAKTYNNITLNMTYDQASRLQELSDGTNTMTYTSRSPGGLPLAAVYSNGIHSCSRSRGIICLLFYN